jgi:hypothetical protein
MVMLHQSPHIRYRIKIRHALRHPSFPTYANPCFSRETVLDFAYIIIIIIVIVFIIACTVRSSTRNRRIM